MRALSVLSALLVASSLQAEVATPLFDGRTLAGWSVLDFGGAGPVAVLEGGVLELGMGDQLTGLVYTNPVARMDYEVQLEARRVTGTDFFCGLTFPVRTNSCTLILGGWGGSVTGISSVNSYDASDNDTSKMIEYERDRWYRVRLRVTEAKIEAWLDDQKVVNLETEGKQLGMRWGDIERCVPLGLATWQTRGQLRNIRVVKVAASPATE